MSSSDPVVRHHVASIAANSLWASMPDRELHTRPARAKFDAKFYDEVDPQRTLAPDELERRASNARQAHFHRLALLSAQARRRAAESAAVSAQADELLSVEFGEGL